MKVRLTLTVDARTRYVVSRYFGDKRTRATREQVRAFAEGALASAVREHADALRGRSRLVAARLAEGRPSGEPLRDPDEKQMSLFAGQAS